MTDLTVTFAVVGALGIGSQWLAMRLRLPAIVFMLSAGVLAGPIFGLLDPEAQFGPMLEPIVAAAVAVILFEGGLSLNFRELRSVGVTVQRLVTVGALLSWLGYALASHFVAGLSPVSSAVFGGLLVVTGPTVVIPLLRQARLAQRPASALKWEAIINDPVGALFAVLAFEFAVAQWSENWIEVGAHLVLGIAVATAIGYLAGRLVVLAFQRGQVAEFMKVPVLLVLVLVVHAATNLVLHESGLLAVTVMGVVIANARLPSLVELRRFKENVTVLLVSGVFVLLSATIDAEMLAELDWRAAAFVAVVVLVVRPLVVFVTLIGAGLPAREKLLIAWIAPRGVVAVAVAGFFGSRLSAFGIGDGALLAGLAFAVTAVTVVTSGFTLAPLGRALGLSSNRPPGVLIVGGNRWTVGLAQALQMTGVPVMMADRNYYRLGDARAADLPTFHGEVLSEAAAHTIETGRFGALVAATDNDDYNALVCTDLGHELGRDRVFQIGRHETEEGEQHMPASIGGRTLLPSGASWEVLEDRLNDGWDFAVTELGENFTASDYRARRPEGSELVALVRPGGTVFTSETNDVELRNGDLLITFTPEPESAIHNYGRTPLFAGPVPPIETLAEQGERAAAAAMARRLDRGVVAAGSADIAGSRRGDGNYR